MTFIKQTKQTTKKKKIPHSLKIFETALQIFYYLYIFPPFPFLFLFLIYLEMENNRLNRHKIMCTEIVEAPVYNAHANIPVCIPDISIEFYNSF